MGPSELLDYFHRCQGLARVGHLILRITTQLLPQDPAGLLDLGLARRLHIAKSCRTGGWETGDPQAKLRCQPTQLQKLPG